MPKYKFYSNRDLAGMILDEQKKLYNQQCFVEDLSIELQSRKNPVEKVDDFVLPTPTVNQDDLVPCTSCQ